MEGEGQEQSDNRFREFVSIAAAAESTQSEERLKRQQDEGESSFFLGCDGLVQ